jgi:PTH1 family peptidyl-tRNA hydrolase
MKLRRNKPPVPAEWLIVGLGNPGSQYARTPHNVGFLVADRLIERWDLGRTRALFGGRFVDGPAATLPARPRVGVLLPQTFMNESGRSASPARGALRVDLDHVIAVHDELDLAFGDVRVRLGGGLAGHNGLKSLKAGLGSPDFQRVRVGVGRPDSTDPETVSAYVLGRWQQPDAEVAALVDAAADAVERLIAEF